jgi:hypothetical protein
MALGKEAHFAECYTKYSAKHLTWEPSLTDPLPSVPGGTQQRWILCRVLSGRHSAKTPSLSPDAVTAAFLCRVPKGTRQTFLPSAREKVLDKEGFVDALCTEPSLPSATLGKAFAECF